MSDGPLAVVRLLTRCARCAHADQLRELASSSTLDRMADEGLLVKHQVLARWPLLEVGEPLDYWFAGDHPTWRGDPKKIAYRAQSRWVGTASKSVAVYVAAPRATKLVGGVATGEIRQPAQVTHDLHVLACYQRVSEDMQQGWAGEDYLRATGWGRRKKVPDAVAEVHGERIAVEWAGMYDHVRIERFQEFCVREGLSYILF